MRIGVDGRYLLGPRRGVGQYLHYLLMHLAQIEGHEYVLFLNGGPSRTDDGECPWDGPSIGERWCSWPPSVLEFLWRHCGVPRMETFLGEIDVFHKPILHCVPPADGAVVVTLHDFVALRFPERYPSRYVRGYRNSLRLVERRADRVIAVSESTKADALRFTRIGEDRIAVVHNGVSETFRPIEDDHVVDRALEERGLTRGYILYVGGADVQKNLDRLLDAYRRLPPALQDEHALAFVGNPSWGYKRLKELSVSMGLEARTMFLGYVPDEALPLLYNGAALVVFPSLYEGFGFIPLEAMACGIPTVSSNASSLPEVVGDAGILVDPLSVDELTDGIQRALTDSALRASLVAKGLQRAKELTWRKAAQATMAVYDHAVGICAERASR